VEAREEGTGSCLSSLTLKLLLLRRVLCTENKQSISAIWGQFCSLKINQDLAGEDVLRNGGSINSGIGGRDGNKDG
jgi:hypothetical protein